MIRILPIFALIFATTFANQASAAASCVGVGQWLRPADKTTVKYDDLITQLSERPVVLLGEVHIEHEHHRWQLHTLAALQAKKPNMVIAFEAFPRSTQSVLDKWVKGDLGVAEFLKQSRWDDVWRFDPNYYLPLFHFARQHRVPMIAMNVERDFVRAVGQKGFDAVPIGEKEGVSKPVGVSAAYRRSLRSVFDLHKQVGAASSNKPTASDAKISPSREKEILEARFDRFVQVQSTWDRAMAEAIYKARNKDNSPLVVGIVGMGHLEFGYGIPHQLKDLGIEDSVVLLPWGPNRTCENLNSLEGISIADVVFGTKPVIELSNQPRPKLGVMISNHKQKVLVNNVLNSSVGATAGIKNGDVFLEAAGLSVKNTTTLISIIQRQAPGTWLPLVIDRNGIKIDVIAKFPIQNEN